VGIENFCVAQAFLKVSSLMTEAQAAPKLDTLHHVAIFVSNVKETVAWYTQHFDCRAVYQDDTWAIVQFANVSLAFVVALCSVTPVPTANLRNIAMGRGRSI
jgi:catechol 2,3-dioxygenase-like lactoylglutathione lyase family enzyme